ncbi:MAG: prepilin-type N-terminal cleavage/methylation domain-containing protein, partial [Candidatus Saccharimonadales bacterium]
MHKRKLGFTIVELLVVIVVIGILAAITVVSYTGISQKAIAVSLQSDLASAKKKLQMYYTDYGSYPTAPLTNNCP